jgi:hypothetical protein
LYSMCCDIAMPGDVRCATVWVYLGQLC